MNERRPWPFCFGHFECMFLGAIANFFNVVANELVLLERMIESLFARVIWD